MPESEFVDGTPLDEALGDAPEGARVRALFQSAAETLRELHRLGVVHGDLKPENVLLRKNASGAAVLKLADLVSHASTRAQCRWSSPA